MLFDPHLDWPCLQQHLTQHPAQTLVVCYCALWCDTCTQYRPQFERLAAQWPQYGFVWVDIEENPEWLGEADAEADVQDFPTLLVQDAHGRNLFFGAQLPYIGHLERLLQHLPATGNSVPTTQTTTQTHNGPPPVRRLLAPAN